MNGDAADRYAIGASLGRGGMGVVYRAVDRATGRAVALKRLATSHADADGFRARFTREVRAMARIHHPNVVGIHASGEDAAGPWFAMDLCEGGSLADRLRACPLSPAEARPLAGDVLAALAAIHGAGLIHRDVKPANILRDGNRWRVSDFGIARDTTGATTVTQAGMILGTPDYLAPEHLRESPVGPAVDLYALGAVLIHALTGAPPYRADTALRLAMLHATAPAPILPEAIRAADPGLTALVDGLLRKDPGDRPTIGAARSLLGRPADAPTPIETAAPASSPSTPTMILGLRRRRWRRGRYAIATALGVATLALGAAWVAGDGPGGGPSGSDATAPATTEPDTTTETLTSPTPAVPAPVVSPPVPAAPGPDHVAPDGGEEYDDDGDHDAGDEHDRDRHGGDDRYGDGYVRDDPGVRAGPGKNGRGKAKGHRRNPDKHQRHR